MKCKHQFSKWKFMAYSDHGHVLYRYCTKCGFIEQKVDLK